MRRKDKKKVTTETIDKAIDARIPSDVIVPTEIVRIYTMEITAVDKNPIELTQDEIEQQGRAMARSLRSALGCDDIVCVKAQQSITKWV